MANEVGGESLERKRDESYKIISFKGPEVPEDMINSVRAPMLNSLRYNNDFFKLIDKESYFNFYPKVVNNLISRPDTQIKFAMLSDETVLGWMMTEKTTLHYTWVKKEARRQGIMRSFLTSEIDGFSHVTIYWFSVWNKFPNWKFNPFI